MKVAVITIFSALMGISAASAALSGAAQAAALPATPADIDLVQKLASRLVACAEQPVGRNERTGNVSLGALRSHCDSVTVADDRVELTNAGQLYTFVIEDSELSDGGDLNDLYLQYGSREDQEVQIARNVLAFGDPVLATLIVTGHKADELPQVSASLGD
jgi:hypothetical protein